MLVLEGALDELKGCLVAGDALADELGVFVDPDVGAVEKQDFRNLLSMIYLRYLYNRFYSCGS